MATLAETLNSWAVTLNDTIKAGQNLKYTINPPKPQAAPQMVQIDTGAARGAVMDNWKPLAVIGGILLALFFVRLAFRGAK